LHEKELIIIVQRSVETGVTISIKDGTDKHTKRVVNKGVDIDGHMEDPQIQIKVLEAAILKIREEMTQTTLPVDKPSVEPKKITVAKEPAAAKK
jgi:hypothetical protein